MDMQEKTKNALQREEEIAKQKKLFIASAVLSIPLLAAMLIMAFTDIMMAYPKVGLGIDLIQFFCATPIVFHFGRQFFIGAYTSLRHRAFTMDTLVAIGTGCSYVYSVVILGLSIFTDLHMMSYFDTSGMLMTFMLLGRFLEANAKRQTSGALLQLMNLVPATAQLLSPEDGETILEVPVSRVKVGDKVRVLAGCRIPVDGHVAEGNSDIDEQAVTGESLPRFVGKGAAVVGGTLNLTATLTVEADKVGEDTMLAKVLRIVEEAQSTKPAVQRIADTVAMYFVPFVILSALVTLVVWLILGATNAYPSAWRRKGNHGMETPWAAFAFNFFISTVVAACPCALGLATPTAIMVGTGVGALHGVLVKSGATLETVCKSSCVVLDKTGTITDGKLQCVTHLTAGEQLPATTVCQIVAGVEGQSTHPVAKAVYEALLPYHQKEDSVAVDVATAVTHSGLGVEATVRVAAAGTALTNTTAWTSHTVLVGNLALLQRHEVQLPEALLSAVTELQRHGRTTVLAAVDGTGCFLAGLSDEPKPESAAVIRRLRKEGIRVLMVTGDHLGVATRVAAEVGIPPEDVHAEALPTTKAEIVKQLQQEERCRVMFVGDGINDSPALAQADVGVALGAGTEIAIEAADAVLVRNSLCDLLTLRALSRTTVRRIYGNFVWAFGYNILMIPIASGALYPVLLFQLPPVVAGAAMVVSSLCVLFSSISIRCFRPVRVEDL
ncbi:Cu2+-exporting ATPase [Angomonas deanei]|uniref:E1-E2 ATPase/haloacid dehalogenase-like hydrolase, putative n=1 Tax=Angomonas deanei TaxID=59799 RepID=A0A7G2C9T2_9TRYP|nr:Cu2+-exporting ATPase [Angomonas deanei]CAD2215627.1 E1-E2 ATPase/haloacid dehalogenase-like hydrolase, putative [Angomonas deanei]|eukprot:EPY22818.1 Cu2+-exporting ATPase [Angomonas deanei]